MAFRGELDAPVAHAAEEVAEEGLDIPAMVDHDGATPIDAGGTAGESVAVDAAASGMPHASEEVAAGDVETSAMDEGDGALPMADAADAVATLMALEAEVADVMEAKALAEAAALDAEVVAAAQKVDEALLAAGTAAGVVRGGDDADDVEVTADEERAAALRHEKKRKSEPMVNPNALGGCARTDNGRKGKGRGVEPLANGSVGRGLDTGAAYLTGGSVGSGRGGKGTGKGRGAEPLMIDSVGRGSDTGAEDVTMGGAIGVGTAGTTAIIANGGVDLVAEHDIIVAAAARMQAVETARQREAMERDRQLALERKRLAKERVLDARSIDW